MASTLSEVDEIRRHMAQIRRELHEDVQGVVRGAEATTDWRRYVKNYPWVALGLAFGVGYLIVPRKRQPQDLITQYLPSHHDRPAERTPAPEPEPKKKGKGIFRTLVGLATPFVLKSAQGYAMQYFEQYLAQKLAEQQSPLANLAASFMPDHAGGPANPGPGANPGPTGAGRFSA